jgi:subtilase family serine protease
VAYGVAPLLRHGITGRGETVAIFALAQTPSDPGTTDIRKDLAAFDSKFGLPRARLHVVAAIAKFPTPYLSSAAALSVTSCWPAIIWSTVWRRWQGANTWIASR